MSSTPSSDTIPSDKTNEPVQKEGVNQSPQIATGADSTTGQSSAETPVSDEEVTLHEEIKIVKVKSDTAVMAAPDTTSMGEASSTVTASLDDISNPSTISTTGDSREGSETPLERVVLTPTDMSASSMSFSSTRAQHGSLENVSEILDTVADDVGGTLTVSGSPRHGKVAAQGSTTVEPKQELFVSGSPRRGSKTAEGTISSELVEAANAKSLVVSGSPRKGKVVSETSPHKDPGNYLTGTGSPRKGDLECDCPGSHKTTSTEAEPEPKTDKKVDSDDGPGDSEKKPPGTD